MKLQCLMLACILGSLVHAPNLFAGTPANPYRHAISGRNLFSLNTVPELPPPPLPPVPAVKLCGIAVIDGKRALIRVPQPARPAGPATEISLILREGAPARAGVQVLEIDVATATVKIDNHGTIQLLGL